jgi:hypothetical protein
MLPHENEAGRKAQLSAATYLRYLCLAFAFDIAALCAQTQTKKIFESVAKQRFQKSSVVRLIGNCCNKKRQH